METVIISRPVHGLEILCMSTREWTDKKIHVFFPDGGERDCTDHPHSGITLCRSWQGHFIMAGTFKEKWVFRSTRVVDIDLEYFGPEWRDCSASVLRE